jgi:hypothetical protein
MVLCILCLAEPGSLLLVNTISIISNNLYSLRGSGVAW